MDKTNVLKLASLQADKTALCILDMINGFAVSGALAGPRVAALIRPIADFAAACDKAGITIVAFADCHEPDSPEFASYPPHCIRGTDECKVCAEIDAACTYTLIEKGSTNGMLEPAMQQWLAAHSEIDTLILVGDCTDICVYQFAVAAKCWFTRQNKPVRILVPANLVDTFDGPGHPADELQAIFLDSMRANGIEVFDKVEV